MSLLAALLSLSALAKEEVAESCLEVKVWDGYSDGWGVRTVTSTRLAASESKPFLVSLYEGTKYRVFTCADEGAVDLDVLLYDERGQLLGKDSSVSIEPGLEFEVKKTGTYYLVLHLRTAAAGSKDAGAALAVVYK